jgi:hypothetical protein
MPALVLIMALGVSGCATTKDVKRLEGEIDAIKSQLATTQSAADQASKAAADAKAAADRAEKAAMDAKAASDATNAKIDNMFKKSMQK